MKAPTFAQFRAWGRQGGLKRARLLSAKRKSEIATIASRARHKRRKVNGK